MHTKSNYSAVLYDFGVHAISSITFYIDADIDDNTLGAFFFLVPSCFGGGISPCFLSCFIFFFFFYQQHIFTHKQYANANAWRAYSYSIMGL